MYDLKRFMDLLRVRGADVARETGLSEAVISRLRAGLVKNPESATVIAIATWAQKMARRHRLPVAQQLNCGVRVTATRRSA